MYGSNDAPFGGSVSGASDIFNTVGSRDANPFVGGSPITPFIPAVSDGSTTSAEIYGLADASVSIASVVAALGGPLPAFDVNGTPLANASLALVRLDAGVGNYNQDFAGFDTLVLLNLTNGNVLNPSMGIDGGSSDLLLRGYTRNTLVGGSGGAITLATLGSSDVYLTLVPDTAVLLASLGGDGASTSAVSLGNGQALYLAVPEPGALILLGFAAIGPILTSRRRLRR
ncbi:MAG: PEP-CTERM sorting domain-containing protein [Pirellulaceae bacterium]|nr:PEP-CTERM sorting domain-containing protein [Pirellulaceae bacterium]